VLEPCNAKVLRTVLRGLGASNRAWLLGGCVASWGQDHLAGNGADFLLVLNSRTLEEPMHEAKQNDDGATRWCGFTHDWWIFHRRANRQQVTIESSRSDSF
jgi:hypothetical protein